MKHATEDEPKPDRTLCGRIVATVKIDNAQPDCRVCQRVIARRYREAPR